MNLKEKTELYANAIYNKDAAELTTEQLHNAVSRAVMADISGVWNTSKRRHNETRRAYYLSAEFLVGRAIYNNLLCLGLQDEAADVLEKLGHNINDFEKIEDAALGNGGLGRLAACFLDSAATNDLPLDGYGIRYRFGLFWQHIEDGFQRESLDDWSRYGDPWSVRCDDDAVTVSFSDFSVRAVPYDMPIIGYSGKHICTLRLWQSEAAEEFDFDKFNEQKYTAAMKMKNEAENISRVLYPNDDRPAGKILRLRQQYFFSSASLCDILRKFEVSYGHNYEKLPEFVTIQLNDTHPVISIPELIRLLEIRGVSFDDALDIARGVFCYTNHTIMQEALEKWDIKTIRTINRDVANIIIKIDACLTNELCDADEDTTRQMKIIQNKTVNMAYLACFVCKKINGVAKIHTDILKNDVLRKWHDYAPEKFVNVTNGVTQRRWLGLCDEPLSSLITELLGDDEWLTDLTRLKSLEKYADDEDVLNRFIAAKRQSKSALAEYAMMRDGIEISPDTIIDAQIKRLHEYKRQLLNILCILEIYFEIKSGELKGFHPTTFLFGAKAAPGYFRAKGIIKLINEVARLINEDEAASRLIKVVFVENYDVSYAEKIVAAANVSEQISTAGTEASGTGNMKLMMNGAVTLGTFDGANIEIVERSGRENNYIFGATVDEIERVRESYNPYDYYNRDRKIKRCLDALIDGTLDDGGTGMFKELYDAILHGAAWHKPDHYFLLLDFEPYLEEKLKINREFNSTNTFARKCWLNICNSGYFSSDRSIDEYAENIWNITKI